MAHEITATDSMLYAIGTPVPWHGLGQEADPNVSIMEHAEKHNMIWKVRMDEIFRAATLDNGETLLKQVPNRYALVREDTDVVLGTCAGDYKLYQNELGYKALDEINAEGLTTLNTLGTLRGGAIVWGLLKINAPQEEVMSGDKVERYILFCWGHDGKISLRFGITDIRAVCANTIRAAWRSDMSQLIRIAHRGNVEANVGSVIKTLDIAAQDFKTTVEEYRRMANTPINEADLRKYVKTVLQLEEKDNNKRATNLINHVRDLAGMGIGNDGLGDNLWGAFNGITQFLSHESGRNADNRYNSLWFGPNANVLKRAHSEAMKLAA